MKLRSERLLLSPLSHSDWMLFLQLHTDKKVIDKCFDEPSLAEIESKFNSRLAPWEPNSEHWLCLVVEEFATGDKIGITGFCLQEDIADIGYLFIPQYHGLGYATESLKALIEYGLNINIHRFQAVVTEGNLASENVLTKVGFTLEEIIPNAFEINGQLYADHIYRYEHTGSVLPS